MNSEDMSSESQYKDAEKLLTLPPETLVEDLTKSSREKKL
jgi:hypothetical protein